MSAPRVTSAALEMAFDLSASAAIIGPGTAPSLGLSAVPGATIFEVARLGDVTGSAFDLLATLVTLTILPENLESELESGGGGALLASFSPGGSVGLGQGMGLSRSNDGIGGGEPEVTNPANRVRSRRHGPGQYPGGSAGPVGAVRRRSGRGVAGASHPAGSRRGREWHSDRVRPATNPEPGSSKPCSPGRSVAVRDEIPLRFARRDQSPLPAKSQEPAGAATNGVWRSEPGAGVSVSVSSRAGFPPVLAAVDAALEELGESVPRANRLLRIVPPAIDEQSDAPFRQ